MRNEKVAVVALLALVAPLVAGEGAPAFGVETHAAAAAQPAGPEDSEVAEVHRILESGRRQDMCADCDRLREQRRIVAQKAAVFADGLEMLQRARREMARNRTAADGIAAAYTILQSLNIAFGLATLPCSISQGWLRGLVGGAAGLGAYVQEEDGGEVALAAVVSSLGLGVVSDTISTYDFMQRYQAESTGMDALRQDLDRSIREFETTREVLRREARALESDLTRGGCRFDPIEELLRP